MARGIEVFATLVFGAVPALALAIYAVFPGVLGISAVIEGPRLLDRLLGFGFFVWAACAWWGALSLWGPIVKARPIAAEIAYGLIAGLLAMAPVMVLVVADRVGEFADVYESGFLFGLLLSPMVVAAWHLWQWRRSTRAARYSSSLTQ